MPPSYTGTCFWMQRYTSPQTTPFQAPARDDPNKVSPRVYHQSRKAVQRFECHINSREPVIHQNKQRLTVTGGYEICDFRTQFLRDRLGIESGIETRCIHNQFKFGCRAAPHVINRAMKYASERTAGLRRTIRCAAQEWESIVRKPPFIQTIGMPSLTAMFGVAYIAS